MRGGLFALQKWLVVYNAMVDPRPITEIAMHTGLAEGTVLRILAEYNSKGPDCLEDGRQTRKPSVRFRERLMRRSVV